MSREARKKSREEALRRKPWQMRNDLAEAARDAFEDMLDILESWDGDMARARHDILDLLAGLQAEAIEAATGPQRPVEANPAKGQRENTVTPEVIDQWRPFIAAAYRKLQAQRPGRKVGKTTVADEAIVQADSEGMPTYSQKTVLGIIAGMKPWPPE